MKLKQYVQGAMLLMFIIIFACLSTLTFTWLKSTIDANYVDEQMSNLLQYEFPVLAWQENADRSAELISSRLLTYGQNTNFAAINALTLLLDPYIKPYRSDENAPSVFRVFILDAHENLSSEHLYYSGMNSNATHLPGAVHTTTLNSTFTAFLDNQISDKATSFWTDSPLFINDVTQERADWYYGRIIYAQNRPAVLILFSGLKSQLKFSSYENKTPRYFAISLTNTHNHLLFSHQLVPNVDDDLDAYHKKTIVDEGTQKHLVLYTRRDGQALQMHYYLKNGWILKGSSTESFAPSDLLTSDFATLFGVSLILLLSLGWSFKTMNKLHKPLEELHQSLLTSSSPLENPDEARIGGEIGNLLINYYALERHILQTETQLETLSEQLEAEVLQKNIELTHTNTLLEASILQLKQQQEELDAVNRLLASNLQLIENGRKRMQSTEKKQSLKYLVSGVAHELNTPIGNAITLSTFAQTEIQQALDYLSHTANMKRARLMESVKRVRTSLFQMEDNIQQALKIIALIDQLSKIETAQEATYLDLERFTRWIAQSKLAHYHRPIQLHIRCQKEAKQIVTDPSKLRQILERLIENSLDHGFANGIGGAITIGYFLKKGVVCLEFYDDGEGVAFENRQHLLTPFFTSAFGTHKGLGLNFAYNICTTYFKGTMTFDFSRISGLGIICSLDSATLAKEVT